MFLLPLIVSLGIMVFGAASEMQRARDQAEAAKHISQFCEYEPPPPGYVSGGKGYTPVIKCEEPK